MPVTFMQFTRAACRALRAFAILRGQSCASFGPMKTNTQRAFQDDQTTHRIRRVLAAHGRLSRDAGELSDDADLYAIGLSSLASVNVMLALEAEFDMEFPDQMLNRSVFESIAAIAAAVRELSGG